MIEITNEQMERVNLILSGIPKGASKAFYNVINRGLEKVKTQSGKSVAKTYRISQKDFKSETNIREKKATQTDLAGQIVFAGTSIPLMKFKVNPKEQKKQTVSVAVLRESGGERLKHAFIAKMKSGHIGVFERTTSSTWRLPIDELYGPAAAGMIENVENRKEIETVAQEIIDKRIEHEISRILNRYGG
jgi:hypothetical protein